MNTAAVVLIAAHVLSMVGFATYAALLPDLRDLYRIYSVSFACTYEVTRPPAR